MFSILNVFFANLIVATAILAMGYFVLAKNAKDENSRIFTLVAILASLWIFLSAIVVILQNDLSLALLFTRLAIFPTFFIFPTLYVFFQKFPKERFVLKKWQTIAIYSPAIISTPFVLTKWNVVSVSLEDWGVNFEPGVLHSILGIYILFIFLLIGQEMVMKFKKYKEGTVRTQLGFILTGIVLMVFFGALANLILPLLGSSRAVMFGPSATIFLLVFSSIAIVKHHLFDVKVLAAEFFGTVLALIMFMQVLVSTSVPDFILRMVLFGITVIIGIMLVKSVIKEVELRREVQRLAKELQSRNVQLKKLDILKTTMVSIASHQLRGPLGGMRGYLTMFKDGDLGPLTDKQKDIIKMNLSTLSRLLNAVETFLDITKIEAGKMVLRKEVLPLDEAVRNVAHEFEIMLQKKGLNLEIDIEENVWVSFDPEKIKHVIFNLVDNAMKYTEKGFIRVTLHRESGEAVITVTDTGRGVLKSDIAKIFGRFERGELAVDRDGSGLGLYIVKMLTEMQGGKVDVTSPGEGKGTTFHVRLPLSQEHH